MLILAYSSNNKILTKCTYGYLWIQQGQKPSARAAHSAVRFGCKVFIFGGRHMNLRLSDLHCLDLSTMTWSGRLEKFTFYSGFFFFLHIFFIQNKVCMEIIFTTNFQSVRERWTARGKILAHCQCCFNQSNVCVWWLQQQLRTIKYVYGYHILTSVQCYCVIKYGTNMMLWLNQRHKVFI